MSTPIPIRQVTLESLQVELRMLRDLIEQLPVSRSPEVYEFPQRIPRAVVQPEKYTSTLPSALLKALRRYAEFRGNENINVIISEALRAHIPREHFDAVLDELRLEYRRLWTEEATETERKG